MERWLYMLDITRLLLDLFLFVFGIVLGVVLSLWVANERVKRGTLIYLDRQGKWQGSDAAWVVLTGQLLYPDENQAEWEEEDDRSVD